MSNERAAHSPSRRRTQGVRLLKILAVLLLLGASLWYTLSDVAWGKLWEAILDINILWVGVGILTTLFAHFSRAVRWRLLIPNGQGISLINSFSATIIGYLINNLVTRLGELVRPYVLSRREGRSVSSLVATVVVERILDGLSLLLIFAVLLLTIGERLEGLLPSQYSITDILTGIAVPLLALIIAMVVMLGTNLGERVLDWIDPKLPKRFSGKLHHLLREFREGISFGGLAGTLRILFWTIMIWGGYAFAFYFGFLAFGFNTTYGLGLPEMVTMLAITAVGITVAPTPGGFGIYHTFCRIGLVSLYGVPVEKAVAFALVSHGAPYLAVTVVGALFLLREGLSLGEATAGGRKAEAVVEKEG